MDGNFDIWKILLEYGLSFLLMGIAVFYFWRKEKTFMEQQDEAKKTHEAAIKAKDEELKALNEQIRADNKDTITTLMKLELVLDKVMDSQQSSNKELAISIKENTLDLKNHITNKLKEIKDA
jgi:ABC-type nickel/cobalt efflux system permease component RcnA